MKAVKLKKEQYEAKLRGVRGQYREYVERAVEGEMIELTFADDAETKRAIAAVRRFVKATEASVRMACSLAHHTIVLGPTEDNA